MQTTHSYEDISIWFFDILASLLQTKRIVTIGLAGGTSFDAWYAGLLNSPEWKNIDIQRISWCVTDERVNCEVKDRNDEHIWNIFFLPFINKTGGLLQFIRPNIDDNGEQYSEKVESIDIAFFGMGPDGHTASLFPNHERLQSRELGFIKIENAPKPPPERISLSPKSIQSLVHTCLFAVGSQKKEALVNFLDDSVSILDCPAKLLKPEILLDLTD